MGGKMFRMMFRITLLLTVLLGTTVSAAAQRPEKMVSLLDRDPEIKQLFGPESPGRVLLFEEMFQDNRHGWPIKIQDGKMIVERSTGWLIVDKLRTLSGENVSLRNDFLIEACFKVKKDPDNKKFGLAWNFKKWECNWLIIDRNGYFNYLGLGRTKKHLLKNKKSSAIKKGDAYNTVSILKRGRDIHAYINGTLVAEDTQTTPMAPGIGFRMGYGKDGKGRSKAEVIYLAAVQIPSATLIKAPVLTGRQILANAAKSETDGFLKPMGDLVLDVRTNRVWYKWGYSTDESRAQETNPGTMTPSYPQAGEWISTLNAIRAGGVETWRLPGSKEYQSIYTSSGYPEEIKGLKFFAWCRDEDKNGHVFFDFSDGKRKTVGQSDGVKGKTEALAVRTGPLDLAGHYRRAVGDTTPSVLNQSHTQLYERVKKAYAAGLEAPGEKLFDVLVDQAGGTLYDNGYIEKMVQAGLPLKLASKLLLAVKDREKHDPVFWYEYARLSGLANQPALVLLGTKHLTTLGYENGFKEEFLDMAAVFDALGQMLLGREDDAYTALLMRFDIKNNLFVPPVINRDAPALIKDRDKLANVTGFPASYFIEKAFHTKPQPFYNIETGQLLNTAESVPALEKAAPVKPADKPESKKPGAGATVLD
jgi:hypothetical protein